jgi:hypothetical protein
MLASNHIAILNHGFQALKNRAPKSLCEDVHAFYCFIEVVKCFQPE